MKVSPSLIAAFCVCLAGRLCAQQGVEVEPRVVRVPIGRGEELLVAHTDDYQTAAQWFLRRPDGWLQGLGEGLSAMYEVHRLLPSADAAFLAVISSGEGHPFLEVIDLDALRSLGRYDVVREVDPYPGFVDATRWSDGDLVVTTDMALTHEGEEGRVSPSLLLPQPEEFRLLRGSWKVEAITLSETELGDLQLARLESAESWERNEAAGALATLGEPRFVPALRDRLRREEDGEVRAALRQALTSIRWRRAAAAPKTVPPR